MKARHVVRLVVIPAISFLAFGCTVSNVDFTKLERPARAAELDAFDSFVGKWIWTAEALNAAEGSKNWTGTAEWTWALDKRCLHGVMSSRSGDTQYDAAGIWSWHPAKKQYIWWMFNNWGYPQEGTATDNKDTGVWRMNYKSVGLDGTDSYGFYSITQTDTDTLDWKMVEWADAFHTIKKIEMKGTYKRQK